MRGLMRGLSLAVALALSPVAASAQRATPSAVQAVGVWGQRVTAAQQPVIDTYQRCSPVMRQLADGMGGSQPERQAIARALMPALRTCIADMKAAAATARDALAAIGPMPSSVERLLGIDSGDLLRRSAIATDGMVKYLSLNEEILDAVIAGDMPAALRKRDEARVYGGSVIDGQIALLETLRQSLPLETHKAMTDVRLALMRATRAIVVSNPDAEGADLAAALHAQGARARAAAAALRADWKREGAGLRSAVARGGTPAQSRMVGQFDTAVGEMAATGDRVADALDRLPSDRIPRADLLRTLDALALAEAHLLDVIRGLSTAMTQVG